MAGSRFGKYQKRGIRSADADRRAKRMERGRSIVYEWSPTAEKFHNCTMPYKGILGPVGCLPCDTEVMTPEGWVRIVDWSGQEILQWEPEGGTTVFHKPRRFIEAECPGGMLAFPMYTVRRSDSALCWIGEWMVVTENHRVAVVEGGKNVVRTAAELAKGGEVVRSWFAELPTPGGEYANREMFGIMCGDVSVRKIAAPDGRQYCFETDTGFFVVRQGGRIFVTGNSGKSVLCCNDLNYLSNRVRPDERGVRRSRWLVVRNTYQELLKTTIKTWLEWFPDTEMHWSSPPSGHLVRPCLLNDGTTVDIELLFYGLDKAEQARGLKGIECSGAWVNEACEVKEEYLDILRGRIGRFPPKLREGEDMLPYGGHGLGIIMDTNAPSDTSWWFRLAEEERPEGWAFFRQPPAVLRREDKATGKIWYEPNDGRDPGVPAAENIGHLPGGYEYYMKQVATKNHDYVKVFLIGEYGTTVKGAAVYPEYDDRVHWLDADPEVQWGLPIFVGTDFGRTPSSVVLQVLRDGQIVVYDEICTEMCSIQEFCEAWLKPALINSFRFSQGARIFNFGDPAGMNPNESDAVGVIVRMNEFGIPTVPSPVPNNSFLLRRDCVAEALRARLDGGKGGLVLGRKCKRLREGFLGRYYYKTMNTADLGDERVATSPEKNIFSHPQDALQYVVYGATHQSGESVFDLGESMRRARSMGGGGGAGGAGRPGGGGMVPSLGRGGGAGYTQGGIGSGAGPTLYGPDGRRIGGGGAGFRGVSFGFGAGRYGGGSYDRSGAPGGGGLGMAGFV